MLFWHLFGRCRRVRAVQLATAIATAAWAACAPGGDRPAVYPVKGKVTYRGKPITEGAVVYELEGGEQSGGSGSEPGAWPFRVVGKIQADGTFQLRAFPDGDGLPEGHYKVGITSRRGRSEGRLFKADTKIAKGNPDVLRGRYADPKTSGLKDEVARDRSNEPSFDLK